MADNYNINKYTYAPSVYKKHQLTFEEDSNYIKILNKNDYFSEISNEIAKRREIKNSEILRPVIVVFETRVKLMEYYQHITFCQFKKNSKYLTELTDKDTKIQIIERATKRGQVTLITSSFAEEPTLF